MFKKLLFTMTLIFGFILSGFAQDISGKWKGSTEGPQGEMELTLTLLVEGENLTGTVGSAMGEIELQNGKVDGKNFSFDMSFNDFQISHNCEVISDNEIRMKNERIDMILTRVEE